MDFEAILKTHYFLLFHPHHSVNCLILSKKLILSHLKLTYICFLYFSAHLLNHELPPNSVRPKRESFVDLNNIPNIMRGFAQNLGRGLNSMVQHSQKIASQGHK